MRNLKKERELKAMEHLHKKGLVKKDSKGGYFLEFYLDKEDRHELTSKQINNINDINDTIDIWFGDCEQSLFDILVDDIEMSELQTMKEQHLTKSMIDLYDTIKKYVYVNYNNAIQLIINNNDSIKLNREV